MPEQPSLAGPLARIERANELLPHLDAALKAFLQTPPYDIEERPDPNPTTRAFVITKLHDVPARPRIIAGEVAHHLRAALDLLAYQLLIQQGVTSIGMSRDPRGPTSRGRRRTPTIRGRKNRPLDLSPVPDGTPTNRRASIVVVSLEVRSPAISGRRLDDAADRALRLFGNQGPAASHVAGQRAASRVGHCEC
jgi:hypothetical protein